MQDIIKINVVKQLDGVNFSLSPSAKEIIKKLFPQASPKNSVFVNDNTYHDFQIYIGKLEKYIYPLLLGIDDKVIDPKKTRIIFIDPLSSKTLYSVK